MVLDGFDNVPAEPLNVEFAQEKVELEFTKSAGMTSFRFVSTEYFFIEYGCLRCYKSTGLVVGCHPFLMEQFHHLFQPEAKDKRIYSSWFTEGKAEKIFGI